MFRGNHPTRVDEKGRLKLPAEFKREIEEKYGTKFYITSEDGKTARVYPIEEWEKVEMKLINMPNSNPSRKRLLTATSYYGQNVEMDSQGRVLLPQILREKANVVGDVAVFGKLTYLEVTNMEAVRQELETNPLTDADAEALGAYGL
ncbi:MAG: division/cell wall cluster transcriptional repressor MraZ [Acidobacteriaceae bacterium]